MPLQVDYRPKDIDEIVGNKSVVDMHRAIFKRTTDWPKSVLYVGPKGCGKTTLAEIYAKNVAHRRDVHHINAADESGIATARDIIQKMKFAPFMGKAKCYVFSEIGGTSEPFQRAILDATENPPKHVYFIATTNEPHKLRDDLKTRFQIYEMSLLSVDETIQLLETVLQKENVNDIPESVLMEIAIVSEGCPRQALIILDQVIDLPIESMLGAIQDLRVTDKTVKNLCNVLLYRKPWVEVQAVLKGLDMTKSEDIRRAVSGWMAGVLLNRQKNPRDEKPIWNQAALTIDLFESSNARFSGRAGIVLACYQSVL